MITKHPENFFGVLFCWGDAGDAGDAPKGTFREKFPLDSFKSFWGKSLVQY